MYEIPSNDAANTMKKLTCLILFSALALALSACSTTDQQVEALIEQLAANKIGSEAWQRAVDALAAIGRPAARQLIAHLNPDTYKGEYYREYRDEKEKIRTGSARALGRIKPRGATVALDDRIVVTTYTDTERIACMWAIGEIGFNQTGLDALKKQLKDKDPVIRLHAAIAIVKMDEEEGVDQIKTALDGDDELARTALEGLEESNYFGVPLLVALASRPGPRQDQLRGVIDRVRKRLVSQLRAEEPEVRQRSAWALGQIGDRSAGEALLDLLDDQNNLVRFNAAAALATMDDPQGIDFLFDALQDEDPILRANAVKFLTQVQQNSGAVEQQLVAALEHDSPLFRSGACQVLGQARVQTAVQPLLAATEDSTPEVRWNAVIALGHIGAPETRDRLRVLLEDGDDTVSYYAEWALRQLGPS